MGQLVKLYAAPNSYIAGALEDALRDAGIPYIQLTNEIPMHTAINYGAGAYADILIDSEDLPRAREVLDEVEHVVCGEDHECERVFPSVIQLRDSPWFVYILVGGLLVSIGIPAGATLGGAGDDLAYSLHLTILSLFNIAALVALLWPNSPLVRRVHAALAPAAIALLVLPFWLCFLFIDWAAHLPLLPDWWPRGSHRVRP